MIFVLISGSAPPCGGKDPPAPEALGGVKGGVQDAATHPQAWDPGCVQLTGLKGALFLNTCGTILESIFHIH